MAQEIKEDYDAIHANFIVEVVDLGCNDYVFLTINKRKSATNYQPVYKTECLKARNGRQTYDEIDIGTHTMFGGIED